MARAFISEQQLEQLIQQSTVDLTEAMKYFPEAARNIQVKQATEAVKSGDKGKLQDLKTQYPSSEMQNLVSALQNRQNVQRLAQAIPVIQKIDDKKEKGEALSPRETNILAQKSASFQRVGKNKCERFTKITRKQTTNRNANGKSLASDTTTDEAGVIATTSAATNGKSSVIGGKAALAGRNESRSAKRHRNSFRLERRHYRTG